MNATEFKQCKKCVLDTTAKYITFDSEGICNHCRQYAAMAKKYVDIPQEKKDKELSVIVSKIKRLGKNNKYDCILGLSGGADSSYLAYFAKQLGLRPLVVHFDNGWNSELAVKNIENIVSKLGYDLYTYVFDWEEFKDLQVAYLKASVVDTEVPTDYLIFAVLNKIAAKENIKYILSGYNYVTEFGMPKGWNYDKKFDHVNLENIHKKFGKVELKKFPTFGISQRYWYEEILGIETVTLLNFKPYIKKEIKDLIAKELDWRDYGGKHHESIFTRFYQDYILPKKFNIDKRKTHWSSLIWSGQATKQEALADLANEPYPKELQEQDRVYVTKKLGLTDTEFESIMNTKPIEHEFYGFESPDNLKFKLYKLLLYVPARISKKIRYIKATGRWKN
ncbi:MAG: N-acetyl sugar amidotransferase [Bacteroidetes bacterium]|nr:N-acetyl sugar amidotransferase [Bacteroidota bacterium]